MQAYQKTTTRIQDLDVAYAERGTGRPVVYIHGAVTTLEEGFIALGDCLGGTHRLICIDRPGHGLSTRGPGTGSAWRQAQILHGLLQTLAVHRPVMVGHSFGAAVAMAYALQFPQNVDGVVALSPVSFPEPRLEHLLFAPRSVPVGGAWLGALSAPVDALLMPVLWRAMFLPQLMTAAFQDRFPFDEAGGVSQLRADGDDAAAMTLSLARSAMLYWTCRVPVEVLQGDRDIVANPLHGRMLAALLPHGRFHTLPGMGHMAHHFVPDRVVQAVETVQRRSADGGAGLPAVIEATAA